MFHLTNNKSKWWSQSDIQPNNKGNHKYQIVPNASEINNSKIGSNIELRVTTSRQPVELFPKTIRLRSPGRTRNFSFNRWALGSPGLTRESSLMARVTRTQRINFPGLPKYVPNYNIHKVFTKKTIERIKRFIEH
jgi:hypothetical protein